ncbi:hypothetical protein [Uliginosibacterium gangwonense]|uniref:hypothetical protein n=1 Tax=Uliginosibacterium gangwonense TaxID=392736 RepID=UPI0012FB9108|nr:hypothetical protein [Uliginosibacterium gangwonense]
MKPVEISASLGVRNDLPPDRFKPGDLLAGNNIEIDETGKACRRLGAVRKIAGKCHSLWSSEGDSYFVQNGWLCRFSDGGLTPIKQVAGTRLCYQRVNNEVFWSDGTETGVLKGASPRLAGIDPSATPEVGLCLGSVPAGSYLYCVTYVRDDGHESGASPVQRVEVGANSGLAFSLVASSNPAVSHIKVYVSERGGELPFLAATVPNQTKSLMLSEIPTRGVPVRTLHMGPAPSGRVLGYYNGRLYVAQGQWLWYSQPYEFELFDRVGGYLGCPGVVTLFAPVSDGVFVGSDREIVFLQGSDPAEFTRMKAANYGAVLGTAVEVPGYYVGDGTTQGPIWMWASERGICMGTSGGQFKELTAGRYVLPAACSGASLFKVRGGTPHLITALRG